MSGRVSDQDVGAAMPGRALSRRCAAMPGRDDVEALRPSVGRASLTHDASSAARSGRVGGAGREPGESPQRQDAASPTSPLRRRTSLCRRRSPRRRRLRHRRRGGHAGGCSDAGGGPCPRLRRRRAVPTARGVTATRKTSRKVTATRGWHNAGGCCRADAPSGRMTSSFFWRWSVIVPRTRSGRTSAMSRQVCLDHASSLGARSVADLDLAVLRGWLARQRRAGAALHDVGEAAQPRPAPSPNGLAWWGSLPTTRAVRCRHATASHASFGTRT